MAPDFSVMRANMLEGQLRTQDVSDRDILAAASELPRELFVPERRRMLAYSDGDIEVAEGRFLMEVAPFAKMLQLAEIRASDHVLEVGAATGYNAAVLSRLARSVVALESDPALAAQAGATLASLGIGNVEVVTGPLPQGWPAAALYDVIVVSGAVDFVPGALLDQLGEGGRLVAVEGRGLAGEVRVHLKLGNAVGARRGFNAAVKPLPGFEREPAFEF
ncbi:MAG TPA: protein-L-isoaspartate O-methyltransferase [Mesorhizobium sp.]|nr:protein-L-isoaspartate O-methyltransferase [Mesorhizobium sp.]